MAKSVYIKTGLTGGSTVADLDGIDGNKLIDGDVSFVYETGMQYAHILNATSGATESSPDIITPDTNPGTKRWLLYSSNVATHATTHILGGGDEIDGDKVDIDWTPAYYTPATNATTADNVDNLTSHLKGIDTLVGSKASTSHASTHASGGSDAVKLDDLAAPDDNDHLNATTSAHGLLKKLDNDSTHYIDGEGNWTVPSTGAAATHATTHITSGGDEIDGDKIDIDWTPAYYTPATNATTADNLDHLTSHLKGIDTLFNSKASTTHNLLHILGGSDEIDGDMLDIDWTPAYYTPATNTTTADNLDNLTAHLKGIDTLFNAKASTAHASTHASGGSDAVKLDDLAAPDDNDHLNATTSRHGLLKKLDNDSTHYMSGVGTWTVPSTAVATHATTHITSGSDEIDGDKVDIDWTPAYYTPATNATTADNIDNLSSHLKGIDTLFNTKASTTHNLLHILGGGDEIDGDKLDIDWTPAYYTPATNATTADNVDNLSSHLKGIDTLFNAKASTAHNLLHITSGGDEIDGDMLDIDWTPAYYTPATNATTADNLDHLTSHLKGIDTLFNSKASTTHNLLHITSGSDEIDGDKLDIDWAPAYYTPATNATTADNLDHLTSHLKGIDTAVNAAGGISNIVEDLTPQLGGDLEYNEKHQVFDVTMTSDDTASGDIITVTFGESVVFGEVCYPDATANEWMKALATNAAVKHPGMGIALESKGNGESGKLLLRGTVRDDGAFAGAMGDIVFLSDGTAGDVVYAAPSDSGDIVQILGFVIAENYIYFNPDYTYLEI